MAFQPPAILAYAIAWLERIDPGSHRRIKGLRLVTAYAIAAMLGTMPDITHGMRNGASLSALAGGFALWASVFEGRATRAESSRDLALLCLALVAGAFLMILSAPLLTGHYRPGPELVLALSAFLVGYLKRFGLTWGGIGAQIFIGELLGLGANLSPADLPLVLAAGILAAIAAIVPRVLSGPAEIPTPAPPATGHDKAALVMGLQAAIASLVIWALAEFFDLVESAWAITACTFVVANSTAETIKRIRHRIMGTAIGVPLALALLPLVPELPILIWVLAAIAMVIYAMALPERYDIACGAYAFTLIVTLAATGETSVFILASRAWETFLGGALGLAIAIPLAPLLAPRRA